VDNFSYTEVTGPLYIESRSSIIDPIENLDGLSGLTSGGVT